MKIIVVGGTAAGLSAAVRIKKIKPDWKVVVYERSGYTSYGSCGLPYYIEGIIDEVDDLISLDVEELREKRGIDAHILHEVVSLDHSQKKVKVKNLETGEEFEDTYDEIVLATGAAPSLPPIDGIQDVENIFMLRVVEDGIAIRKAAETMKKAIILGGGYIGLEVAEGLIGQGVEVHLVDRSPRFFKVYQEAHSEAVGEAVDRGGVTVHRGEGIEEVLSEDGVFKAVKLSDGTILEADFFVVATGTKPNTKLGEENGVMLGEGKAYRVNKKMETSVPGIWACGDCATTTHILTRKEIYYPLAPAANKQGRVCGENVAGKQSAFPGVLGSQIIKVFDTFLAATGFKLEEAKELYGNVDSVTISYPSIAGYYPGGRRLNCTLVFTKPSGRIVGCEMSGDVSVSGRVNAMVAAMTKEATLEEVEFMDFMYTPAAAPVYDILNVAAREGRKKL